MPSSEREKAIVLTVKLHIPQSNKMRGVNSSLLRLQLQKHFLFFLNRLILAEVSSLT